MIKIDLGQVCLESASGGRLANSPEGVDSGWWSFGGRGTSSSADTEIWISALSSLPESAELEVTYRYYLFILNKLISQLYS